MEKGNQTINNCWKKLCFIDCEEKEEEEKEEEIDCLIEKEVTKYTYALDGQLKMINRVEFFKQFLHLGLLTNEFICKNSKRTCKFVRRLINFKNLQWRYAKILIKLCVENI